MTGGRSEGSEPSLLHHHNKCCLEGGRVSPGRCTLVQGPCCSICRGTTRNVLTALHFTALYCTALHCTVLYCTALYCTALYRHPHYLLLSTLPTVTVIVIVFVTVFLSGWIMMWCIRMFYCARYCAVLYFVV
jgi:hypothetical protein